ncbi:hypothetical protein GCM10011329_12010 [Stakelama pacifica]|nr:hypothetical protein GCM10011329_12010 [Stakelama pacifica]
MAAKSIPVRRDSMLPAPKINDLSLRPGVEQWLFDYWKMAENGAYRTDEAFV